MVAKLQTFQKDIPLVVKRILRENEGIFVEMVSEDQLYERGVDRNNNPIQPNYAPITISIKRTSGQPTDRVTTRDSGDFHNSFYIKFYGNISFGLAARERSKAKALTEKYGDILDWTDEHLNDIIHNYIKPALIRHLKR